MPEISEIVSIQDLTIVTNVQGECWSFNRFTKATMTINKSDSEKIRSIFYNKTNESVFIVALVEKF